MLKPFRVFRIEDYDNKEDPKVPKMIGQAETTQMFNIE